MKHQLDALFNQFLGRSVKGHLITMANPNIFIYAIAEEQGEDLDSQLDWLRGNEANVGIQHDGKFWLIGDGDDNGAVKVEDRLALVWIRHLET